MTLEQLRTFLWVARLGGVRRAAQQMNVSQPAISARISALEDTLGVELFTRAARGVTPTREGVLLRSHAEQIIASVERIRAEIVPPERLSSLLRIGAAETIVQTWLPEFLRRLGTTYPRLKIEITVDISLNLREALLDRALDLAFLMGPVSEYSVDNLELPPVPLAWYRPLAMEAPDLSKVPVITYNRQSRPHRHLAAELHARHGGTAQIFPSNSLSTAIEMIAAGLGVGVIPECLGRRHVTAGRIAEFDPGWRPEALMFSASYIGNEQALTGDAARIARDVATGWR
ncbi:LysR family transcriptional regulator [Limimaricola cinnabarinus]|jgi:DNA-binding transcriptional LysR family regulator|uniref:LysR family transcriptional regulator n=1 Tax=Limimaricola cinnabarinus TaxID=1125964 RepID=A0A2G1MCK9_9RHOB|nr:LysR family transcriptional regulator [Limimaricola cinnabarinus]PHP26475.1 LysR family transcriptional regulator [Limimaricola cinnabarinus]